MAPTAMSMTRESADHATPSLLTESSRARSSPRLATTRESPSSRSFPAPLRTTDATVAGWKSPGDITRTMELSLTAPTYTPQDPPVRTALARRTALAPEPNTLPTVRPGTETRLDRRKSSSTLSRTVQSPSLSRLRESSISTPAES